MNSYTLADKLRKARRRHVISADAQGLFYELVAINNEDNWSDVFVCRNGELASALNVAEKTLIRMRDELAAAELVGFQSGKSVRQPCRYSLNGSLNGLPVGLLNGGKIYSSYDSQVVSHAGEKVTDIYNKHKTKSKTETKTIEVVDDNTLARKKLIEEAIDDCYERDNTGNVAYPGEAFLPEEKEKSSAKKEKVLPTLDEATDKIIASNTCHWWNVIEFYLGKELLTKYPGIPWEQIPEPDKQEVYDQRRDLFKKFYATKTDNYKIRLPTWNDVAQNFYNWVPTELNREKLQILNKYAINRAQNGANSVTKNNAAGDRNSRNKSIEDVVNGSESFLREHIDPEYD